MNFITAHDGFTMNDLVTYNNKHNMANGEDNRDGESNNRSWNCGVEGPTTISDVNNLRQRQLRNLFSTLLVSQGIPMICGGDEVERTQQATTMPTARTTRYRGAAGTPRPSRRTCCSSCPS